MPQIYLHIGLHKTGTTAIQSVLFNNAAAIARQGIHLSCAGIPPAAPLGHHELAWAHSRKPDLMAKWDDLAQEITSTAAGRLIITSEEFCVLGADSIARIGDFFARFGGARIVVYLRNQVDLGESLYRTDVLHYSVKAQIGQYLQRTRTRLDYQALLDDWTAAFGKDNVIVRLYEKSDLTDGVLSDFCRIVGLDAAGLEIPPKDINHGLSFDAIVPIQKMRQYGLDKTAVDRFIMWAYRHNEGRFTCLSKSEAAAFMKSFEASNRAVARRFFDRDTLFHEFAERSEEPLIPVEVMASTLARVFRKS